ncbi:hypothetical protein IEQ34_006596 [Dendrobium chrysotoxum]|uniref:Uncharacterized protein n=1 Tax=Dendrobium chrysotoxum TaxID=161865 RepID=A0AAV7H703_DENCH|nr:hypothetical protein IEQ34_006596 [Dendrobium chrysotoxum]
MLEKFLCKFFEKIFIEIKKSYFKDRQFNNAKISLIKSICSPLNPPLFQPSIYLPKAFHYKIDLHTMAICGAHPLITIPTSSILSLYPFGIQSSRSFLTTQTNGSLDSSSPIAISLNCSIENRLPLPKHMYTTEPIGLLSSHFKHLLTEDGYSPPLVDLLVTSLLHRETGPTFQALPIASR